MLAAICVTAWLSGALECTAPMPADAASRMVGAYMGRAAAQSGAGWSDPYVVREGDPRWGEALRGGPRMPARGAE